jgi:RNA recognition motif-containing protein
METPKWRGVTGKEHGMVIFVGNLSTDTSEQDLRDGFERYGQVGGMNVMRDEISGRPLGFGFIEMPDDAAAQQAIAGLNRATLKGATLIVCETTPRVERRRSVRKPPKPRPARRRSKS